MKKYLLLSLAALVSAQAATPDATAGGDDSRRELKRRPSFKALEVYRSNNPMVGSEKEYYEDTDTDTGAAAAAAATSGGMKKYRPYARMDDITAAGQSSAKLVEEMNRDEDMPRSRASAMPGMMGPKEYPFSEAFRDLQRAEGDVETRPDGTVRYQKVSSGGGAFTMKAVPKMMPKPEIQAALTEAKRAYDQAENAKKHFITNLASTVSTGVGGGAVGTKLSRRLNDITNPTTATSASSGASAMGMSDYNAVLEIVKEALEAAKDEGRAEALKR